jgi:catechol 2,3-dioxygenase-like lactoylglutathione lyase family enzyme
MPSIHSSERPPLGWLVPCLAVDDLSASLEFYARLDLLPYGGDVAENWAMLRNRAIEIHLFQGHIPRDLLNFRGGDPEAIRAALRERGLEVAAEEGPASFIYLDPDGREVFFDTSPEEQRHYEAGHPLTSSFPGDDVQASDGLDLGNLACCLACGDLRETVAFYETLGLVRGGGEPESGWAIMSRIDHPPVFGRRQITPCISLFEGMIPSDLLNFRGGHVSAIAGVLAERGADLGTGVTVAEDGGESILLRDPDGRGLLLDTTPRERLYDG